MKKTSGWYNQSIQHAFAARGITIKEPKINGIHNKKIIVVDLDGTVFDITKRWNLAKNKYKEGTPQFWDSFMDEEKIKYDIPINKTADRLQQLKDMGYKIC